MNAEAQTRELYGRARELGFDARAVARAVPLERDRAQRCPELKGRVWAIPAVLGQAAEDEEPLSDR